MGNQGYIVRAEQLTKEGVVIEEKFLYQATAEYEAKRIAFNEAQRTRSKVAFSLCDDKGKLLFRYMANDNLTTYDEVEEIEIIY